MMLVRPQGLFGMHEIWDYWPSARRADKRRRNRMITPRDAKSHRHQPTPPSRCSTSTSCACRFGGLKAVQNFSLQLPPARCTA